MGLMHMQGTQPKQPGVFTKGSSASLESRVLKHMKIVNPPPGIEPGLSTFRMGMHYTM